MHSARSATSSKCAEEIQLGLGGGVQGPGPAAMQLQYLFMVPHQGGSVAHAHIRDAWDARRGKEVLGWSSVMQAWHLPVVKRTPLACHATEQRRRTLGMLSATLFTRTHGAHKQPTLVSQGLVQPALVLGVQR